VANLEQIVQKIIRAGFSRKTPCALVENGTKEEERFISGRLDNIVKRARDEAARPPAILVVGEVVRLSDRVTKRLGETRPRVVKLQCFPNRGKPVLSERGSVQAMVRSTRGS
ncbi:MAG: hypothetical protein ACE5NJ_01395, partial [Thermodesulfobacteriota bacterium]